MPCGRSKSEVATRLAQLKIELAEKRETYDVSTETSAQFLKTWVGSLELAPSTKLRYQSLLTRHVLGRRLAEVRLCDVEAAHVLRFYADLRSSTSASTVKKVHSLLHSAFESARHTRAGFARNPCDLPRNQRPKYKPRDPAHPFDADKEAAFLAACDGDPWEALYVLALDSGMRQAELFSLEWRDFDWENCSVEVRRTLKDTEDGLAVGDTKNRQRRSIRVSTTTVDALASHRKRQSRAGGAIQRLVFPDQSGGYLRRQNFNRRHFATMLAKAERESGLPFAGHTFHDTRHTCATLLLQDGESITRVSQRLGHSTVKTTLDYYAHCVPQDEDRPAARFDQRRLRAIESRIGSPGQKTRAH